MVSEEPPPSSGTNSQCPPERIVRFAYGAVAGTPTRVYELEKLFSHKAPIPQLIDEAVGVIKKTADPMTDVLGKAEFRLHVLEVLAVKALRTLLRS